MEADLRRMSLNCRIVESCEACLGSCGDEKSFLSSSTPPGDSRDLYIDLRVFRKELITAKAIEYIV